MTAKACSDARRRLSICLKRPPSKSFVFGTRPAASRVAVDNHLPAFEAPLAVDLAQPVFVAADRGERHLAVPAMEIRQIASSGRRIAVDLEGDIAHHMADLRPALRFLVLGGELQQSLGS